MVTPKFLQLAIYRQCCLFLKHRDSAEIQTEKWQNRGWLRLCAEDSHEGPALCAKLQVQPLLSHAEYMTCVSSNILTCLYFTHGDACNVVSSIFFLIYMQLGPGYKWVRESPQCLELKWTMSSLDSCAAYSATMRRSSESRLLHSFIFSWCCILSFISW